jgi:DcmR-like sensory protein
MELRPDGLGLYPGDHVCGFYSGAAARDELTAAWVTEGARSGQKCVCFIEESALLRERFENRIPSQLRHVDFWDVDDAYLANGSFSKETMLTRLNDAVAAAWEAGYQDVRLLGDMSWVIRPDVDTKEVFAYEAEVNALSPRHRATFVCLYDLDRFDGALVVEILRTHAKVLLNGLAVNNPYFTQPRPDVVRT